VTLPYLYALSIVYNPGDGSNAAVWCGDELTTIDATIINCVCYAKRADLII
jgi:hypothetical protein